MIGAVVGLLTAFLGVGGGFIMVPAMIYLLRMPTNIVIGTSIFQIIFITAAVTILHASFTYTLDVVLALILAAGGVIGGQFGVSAGQKFRGEQLRAMLAADGAGRRPSALVRSRAEAVGAVQHRSAHGGGVRCAPRSASPSCFSLGGRRRLKQRPTAAPAPREEVQSELSTREISIQSNFTGIEILIYGSVDFSQTKAPDQGIYDVIIVIRSPSQPLVARRKERVAGIWINSPGKVFPSVPGFYAALSTRPFRAITSDETLKAARHRPRQCRFRQAQPKAIPTRRRFARR